MASAIGLLRECTIGGYLRLRCGGGEAQGKTGDGGHLAQAQAVGQGVLQIAHLGLAARTGAAALALVGALLSFQRYVIFLRNTLADLFELVADVLSSCHIFVFVVAALKIIEKFIPKFYKIVL